MKEKMFFKFLPKYCILPFVGVITILTLSYSGTKFVNVNFATHDLTTCIDTAIPFFPPSIYIYVLSYVYWIAYFVIISRTDSNNLYKTVSTVYLTYTVTAIIFIVFPTAMVRPDITSVDSFTLAFSKLIYDIDTPTNLFPSMHCLMSWICYIGVRGRKDTSIWVRVFAFVFSVLIFLSTVLFKQHFVVDIAGGVILAELGDLVVKHTKIDTHVGRFFGKVNKVCKLE